MTAPVAWRVHPPDPTRAKSLARAAGLQPITAQLLLNRGIASPEAAKCFLAPDLSRLGDPLSLPDMAKGVARLRKAIVDDEPILIFGDADVDGITATAILYEVLRSLGATVRVRLSNRIEDGYGLSAPAIAYAKRSGIGLVVLVDCGTNQAEPVDRLTRSGIDVVIVDHHRPMEGVAAPLALINPHRTRAEGRELCSAGLAFKVAQALLAERGTEALVAYLDLAALGTLADYVPLMGESRILVAAGLSRITNSLRPGLNRLCEATGTSGSSPDSVIRRLVPRLNAFGRLGDPTSACNLLLATDGDRMEEWLAEAEEAHATTRGLQRRIIGEAEEQVSRLHFRDQFVLVVSRTGWHQGLMGPLASQLAARYGRPAIALALENDRGIGSGRSIPLFDLLDALKSCRELLVKFGGHAQACGLTVDSRNLESFRALLNERAQSVLGREGLVRTRTLDLEVSLEAMHARWVEESRRFAPFGPGNPRPTVLIRNVAVERTSPRAAWLTDGVRQISAKGRLADIVPGARYDVAATFVLADGEPVLTVSDAKGASGPSGPARI